MEWWFQIIKIILLCSMSFWRANSSTTCPIESGCFCFEGYVQCSGSTSYPLFFPNGTTHISLFSIKVDEIPKGTMENIPYLESFELYQSKIGKISRGAFSNIKVKTFSLYNVDIGEIETFAFNNLSDIESFSIYGATVGTIRSYAFSYISNVQTWGMSSVDFNTVESQSFYNFSVGTFQLFNSVIGDMKRAAIAHVDKIQDYEIHTNEFGVIECGTVETLLRLANISSFYENIFQCDCKLSWMLNDDRIQGYLFSNWCEMPNTKEKVSLENFDIGQLTCDGADDGCLENYMTSQTLISSTDAVEISSTENSVSSEKTTFLNEGTVTVNTRNVRETVETISMETETLFKETTPPGDRKRTKLTSGMTSSSTSSFEFSTRNGYTESETIITKVKASSYHMEDITTTKRMSQTTKQSQKETQPPKQGHINVKDNNSSTKMLTSVYLSVFSLILINSVI